MNRCRDAIIVGGAIEPALVSVMSHSGVSCKLTGDPVLVKHAVSTPRLLERAVGIDVGLAPITPGPPRAECAYSGSPIITTSAPSRRI